MYLGEVLNIRRIPKIINGLARVIRKSPHEFDAIAFRGMSGALVVPMLCRRLKKEMIVCRKESEKSHGQPAEGYLNCERYIIVDDFIASGATIRGIVEAIDDETRYPHPTPVAVYLYGKVANDNDRKGVKVRIDPGGGSEKLPIYLY